MASRIVPRANAGIALGLIAALLLSGCSNSSGSLVETESSMGYEESLGDFGVPLPEDGRMANPEEPLAEGTEGSAMAEDTAEILTATVALRVEDPNASADRVREITEASGGRVSYSVARPGNDYEYGSAELLLRLPPDALQSTIDAIESYGTVISSESGSQDVSRQKTDYEIRAKSLRTSIDRLNGLLAKSATAAELIEIERELQARESELEVLTAQLTELNDRVDFATLKVSLTAESKSSPPKKVDPESFLTGLERGLEGLLAFGAGFLVVLGVLIPWMIPVAIIGSIALLIHRLRRKKRARSASKSPVDRSSTGDSGAQAKGTDG